MKARSESGFPHIFGPVSSRRLGRSLGLDMVPPKTCSLNCAYCECGQTTVLTLERKPYVSAATIAAEIDAYLEDSPPLDFITFGGSGEPTLNSDIGRILSHIKQHHPSYACALLTNATMFHLPTVRRECLPFDLVLPSLDAVSEQPFSIIGRPCPDLRADQAVSGLRAFARAYAGRLWVEVFVIPEVNDAPEEIAKLREVLNDIAPERVQLNTLDRPAAEDWVRPAPVETLRAVAEQLRPLPVEIVARSAQRAASGESGAEASERVVATCRRRPLTLDDIVALTGLSRERTRELVETLLAERLLATEKSSNQTFYRTV